MSIERVCGKIVLILLGLSFSALSYSQDSAQNKENYQPPQLVAAPPPTSEIYYEGSLQGGGGIIYPVTNHALTESLQGVYYVHFSPQYAFLPHWFAGLELEDYQLGITGNVSAYNTNMFTYGAGIKVGHYSWMQHDFLITYSIAGGITYIKFSNVPASPEPKGGFYKEAPFITPNFFVGYRVNNELRIGLEISYLFNFYTFNPHYLGLDKFIDYSSSDLNGISTCFTWGFGVYEAFSEKRTIAPSKDE